MATPETVHADFALDDPNLIREYDLSDPDHPVDNVTFVVGGDPETGRVDFITRWQPNRYCSLHRHLADTISIVLSGEHWVEKEDGTKKRRLPGHYACTKAGEIHREFAGPEGSTVFFSMQSEQGRAFQGYDAEGNPRPESTVLQMLSRGGKVPA